MWKALKRKNVGLNRAFMQKVEDRCVGQHGCAAWEWYNRVACCCTHGHDSQSLDIVGSLIVAL